VIVVNLEYFGKLSELLKKTRPRTLANYLGWRAAKSVVAYLNKAAQKIDQDYDRVISGIQVFTGFSVSLSVFLSVSLSHFLHLSVPPSVRLFVPFLFPESKPHSNNKAAQKIDQDYDRVISGIQVFPGFSVS
jgi:hypothetical protein